MLKLLLAFLFSLPLFGQTTVIQRPDCLLPLGLITTAPTNAGPFDNRTAGCTFWAIIYNSNGFSVLSLVVQTAPDAGGVPGSWSTFTAASGINPNTAITQATSTFGGSTSFFPWLRVQLTSKTGTGSISGALYGWKTIQPISAVVVPGGTQDVNLIEVLGVAVVTGGVPGSQGVGGLAADGAAVAGNPTRIAGKDGSGNTQDIVTDTSGHPLVIIQGNPTVLSGQQTVTAAAVALATNTAKNICVKALRGNAAEVYIGPSGVSTATGLQLEAGAVACAPVTNTNLIFVIAAAAVGDAVSWIATN